MRTMATVALAGTPGSPGVTTAALALLLTWPLTEHRRVLLAECDPDGGAVLPGALQGRVEGAYGLRNLAVADRRGLLAASVWEQLIDLSPDESGTRLLLPGVTDPAQTPGLAYTWDPLARLFGEWHTVGVDVLVDLGRGGASGAAAALVRRADAVLMVVRATLRGIAAAQPRLEALRADLEAHGTGAAHLGAVVVGEGPYGTAEVAKELGGVPVLGALPYAPAHARVLSDGAGESSDRRFVRSELMRAARSLADTMRTRAEERRRMLAAPRERELGTGTAPQQAQAAPPSQPVPPPQTVPPSGVPAYWGVPPVRPPSPGVPATFGPAPAPDSAQGGW
ncbi:hypothetical protein BIV57_13085 [Mangrovactinospora gilvigrisea]|uniref:CobQ/CobB/MinD/ParA nucleotide binding domain-containing protein n=1 Tax=Mangrovactinospora gilvigrisea TaxID=1428644 RepID=A0A1J7C6A3_9ACTN|nr:hypothetical protein [Mangrovactinospora gilvigrisea]OIV37088.1 hypothetical protein BIV57_13085 [Mangrovactinospora gilvigrisea]